MKVVDLHPDDLLDKEARGELTEIERTRLETHLARCETCRFEREVRDDFAEELFMAEEEEVPSQRLPPLVSQPEQLDQPAPLDPELEEEVKVVERRISTRPGRIRKNLRVALLVAAAVMIGSAATASSVGGRVWAQVASALSLETTSVEVAAPPTATVVASHAPPQKRVVAPEPTSLVVPETSSVPPESPMVPVALATPIETPASLFDAANKARNAGDYGRAITLHRKLETTFPHSREAQASYATLGRLLLDRGDAMGALQAFDAYKAPGPLDEAVLVGRATALERLGREGEARNTWTQLLRDFPDTPYREHAESRLKKP